MHYNIFGILQLFFFNYFMPTLNIKQHNNAEVLLSKTLTGIIEMYNFKCSNKYSHIISKH